MTFRPLSVPVQNKQVQHRRDRALQKPWWRSASGSIFSPPSKLFAGTSALHRLTCTPRTLGRALQRLPSYATESGGGMLIILRGFFLFVCSFGSYCFVWLCSVETSVVSHSESFTLQCAAVLLSTLPCTMSLWNSKCLLVFCLVFFLRVFCFFSPNTC